MNAVSCLFVKISVVYFCTTFYHVTAFIVIPTRIAMLVPTSQSECSTDKQHSTTILAAAKTQYTIDDSVCPPTRPHILRASVTKACASMNTFLSKKPIAAHTQQAFETLVEMVPDMLGGKKIVLDSGCGTGRSSLLLGEMYPDHLVIGVDRSFTRISKTTKSKEPEPAQSTHSSSSSPVHSKRPVCDQVSDNVILVRAELVDFWTCCLQHKNVTIQHHFILYPNPYPTQTRVTQRWYAHPSFPMLLKLQSETITIRSNWKGYLNEFAKALEIANEYYYSIEEDNLPSSKDGDDNYARPYLQSAQRGPTRRTDKSVAWTNFEQKYDATGEETYELLLTRNI